LVALNTVISRPQDEQVSSHTLGPLAASALRVSGVRRPPSCAMSDLLSRQDILTAENVSWMERYRPAGSNASVHRAD
jgi:hypothetical protein